MISGLNIRDFFKEYRELRYENSGSIGFTDIEKNAYRLSLTLEVTHVDAPRYSSLKTLPENTHYGYVTLFRGSTITETIPVKYPKFRVFDITNQAIWNYHQSSENVRVLGGAAEQVAVEASNLVVRSLNPSVQDILCFAIRLVLSEQGEQDLSWALSVLGCDSGTEPASGVGQYRAFPIASPFPDIAKFKADIPCSFLWRLEAWYLFEPAFYGNNSPTDSSDETDGEDEFPEPEQGDGDGDGDEFPEPSPPGVGRDPRDFSDEVLGVERLYRVSVSGQAVGAQGTIVDYSGVAGEFSIAPNGLPLTADASDSPSNAIQTPQTYFGLEIRDRFGGLVNVFAPVVSFPKGGHTVTVELLD